MPTAATTDWRRPITEPRSIAVVGSVCHRSVARRQQRGHDEDAGLAIAGGRITQPASFASSVSALGCSTLQSR